MSIKEIWELDQTSMVDLIVNLQAEKRELEAQNKELEVKLEKNTAYTEYVKNQKETVIFELKSENKELKEVLTRAQSFLRNVHPSPERGELADDIYKLLEK